MNTDQPSNSSDESPDAAASSVDAKSSTKSSTVNKAGANNDVTPDSPKAVTSKGANAKDNVKSAITKEFGGPKGLEPTRYGDWEKNGRCTDF